jgi:Protein of unknown function (DUF664)
LARYATSSGESPSLRRILIDMIEEYARHVGHADLIRESVDGLTGEDPPDWGGLRGRRVHVSGFVALRPVEDADLDVLYRGNDPAHGLTRPVRGVMCWDDQDVTDDGTKHNQAACDQIAGL